MLHPLTYASKVRFPLRPVESLATAGRSSSLTLSRPQRRYTVFGHGEWRSGQWLSRRGWSSQWSRGRPE